MKQLIYIILPLFLIGCGLGNSDAEGEKNPGSYIMDDHLMSEGSATFFGSKYMYDYLRFRNPLTGQIPANIRQKEMEFAAGLPVNYTRTLGGWDKRGPVNVGGRTRTVTIDVLDENVMLAAGVTGGIWRTTDGGTSWTKVTDQLQSHSVTTIVQDTRSGHENVWYAGTGEHYSVVSHVTWSARFSGNGLLKSTDNGLSWSAITSTVSNTPTTYVSNGDMDFVWRVVTDPSDVSNDVVLAAVYNGIYRSEDGGDNWTQVIGFVTGGAFSPACNYLDLVVSPTGVFYCTFSKDGPTAGVYRSEDGINWTNITPSGFATTWGRLAIAINPLDEDVIWFFGDANTGYGNDHAVWRYEYLSGDGTGAGGAWSDRSANLPDVSCYITEISAELGKLSTQSSYDVHIGIHPTDTSTIFIAGTSIWRNNDAFTHDSTNTWIGGYKCDTLPYNDLNWSLSYPNHHPDQHYITFLPSDPSVMINANDGGLFKSVDNLADSVEWIPLNNGYTVTQFYSVAIEPGQATSDIIIGGLQDNGTWWTNTSEFDSSWKYIGSGDGMYCALTNGAEYYLTSKQNGKLYLKQIDANGNVTAHERIDPEGGPGSYNWCNRFILDPTNNKRVFWNGRIELWRLDDMSQINISGDRVNKEPDHWVQMTTAKPPASAGLLTDIEMCQSDSNKVWIGTAKGKIFRIDDAYGLNGDPGITEITGGWQNNTYVSAIAVNPFNSDQIVITLANYGVQSIWLTYNGGVDWEDISGNLEEFPDGTGSGPAVLWCEYYVDGRIFVGTTTGLYTTIWPDGPDSTNTIWTLEPEIGNVVVDHMDFRTHDGFFVVGTHGQGVFSTHLPVGYVGQKELIKEIKVYPSLASEFIQIEMPESADRIEIYSMSGKLVHKETPTQSIEKINVSALRSGTYIVVVRSGDKVWNRKIVKR
ncbi:MAG: T9SS type A sorting domain-containing protein [Crocinitomicaceae bacterium]|nr:T9SS type A sorting domain-containing protein [Crocinitomicaceae bacterium]